jgi:hypothetical protein
MGFIKKYKMFTEEVTMAPPTKVVKPVVEEDVLEATAADVVDRFARLYKDLPKEKKQEINNYFK